MTQKCRVVYSICICQKRNVNFKLIFFLVLVAHSSFGPIPLVPAPPPAPLFSVELPSPTYSFTTVFHRPALPVPELPEKPVVRKRPQFSTSSSRFGFPGFFRFSPFQSAASERAITIKPRKKITTSALPVTVPARKRPRKLKKTIVRKVKRKRVLQPVFKNAVEKIDEVKQQKSTNRRNEDNFRKSKIPSHFKIFEAVPLFHTAR